jgi:transcriptional regulator GlxA family with amidase domain
MFHFPGGRLEKIEIICLTFSILTLLTREQMSDYYPMTLSTISFKKGPVHSRPPPHLMDPSQPPVDLSFMIGTSTTATHTFDDAPALDVLFVPGGMGIVALEQANDTTMEAFVARRLPELDYLLSVCTGAVTLARAGALRGRRATTNKASWAYATAFGDGGVTWVPSARWVEDGKVWTSSGVASGMDMTFAFLKHLYGEEKLVDVMKTVEYAPHTDPHWDPFAVVNEVPGADKSRSLEDCVKPAGFQ